MVSLTEFAARRGWLSCVLGAWVLLVVSAADDGAFHAARGQPSAAGAVGFVIGVLFALGVVAGLMGSAVGVPLQCLARSRCRSVAAVARTPTRASSAHRLTSPVWAHRYRRCRAAADRFHHVVDAVPAGPGREWLEGLADTVEGHVAAAARTARLGQNLCPGLLPDSARIAEPVTAAARQCARRLDASAVALEDLADRVVRVAVALTPEPDLDGVRCQLDMLEAEAPLLRPTADGSPASTAATPSGADGAGICEIQRRPPPDTR